MFGDGRGKRLLGSGRDLVRLELGGQPARVRGRPDGGGFRLEAAEAVAGWFPDSIHRGPHFGEERLLGTAHQYQLLTDWHTRCPEGYA